MRAFLSLLLGLSLSGTLLTLALIALRRLVGARLPSAFYYCAWLLVLLRFVLPLPGLMPGFARAEMPPAVPLPAAVGASPLRAFCRWVPRRRRLPSPFRPHSGSSTSSKPCARRASG